MNLLHCRSHRGWHIWREENYVHVFVRVERSRPPYSIMCFGQRNSMMSIGGIMSLATRLFANQNQRVIKFRRDQKSLYDYDPILPIQPFRRTMCSLNGKRKRKRKRKLK